jgi:conjugal transfer/entry exclusion protein
MKTEQELIKDKEFLQGQLKIYSTTLSNLVQKDIENIYQLSEYADKLSHAIKNISIINDILELE